MKSNIRTEVQGGVDSTLLGFSTSIGPILLFVGILGSHSLAAAFWATVLTATLIPALALLLRGHAAVLPGTRTASLTVYIALVLQLGFASTESVSTGGTLSAQQLLTGLAAGSLLFACASALILILGLLRLGNIFKMIPSTVTAGIGNGTALLLVWLAAKQMAHGPWTVALAAGSMLLGFFLWSKMQDRVLVLKALPAIVVALLIGLTIGMNTGLNTGMAVPTPPSPAYFDFSWVSLRLWPALRQEPLGHLLVVGLPGTITLALVMVLESFTANHVMEMRFGLRIDANRQLVVLGGSNIVSAILGGVPCTSSTVRCVANWNAGGRGPASALASLTITGGLMLAFGSLLMALPAGVVAGLFLLQAPLMADPTFTSRLAEMLRTRRLHREGAGDLGFWITFVISLTGFLGGLIWASFMGIGLSALAVLRRVSSNLTARWGYLNQYHSRRVRSAGEARNLERAPHRVGVLQLTGHLFFGNSTRLTQMVEELHEDATAALIDVSHVHDVDPSGLNALNYVVRALLDRSLTVVLTGLQRTASIELKTALGNLQGVQYRVDLDHGLELCEEFVLQNSTVVAISPQTIPLVSNQLLQDLDASEIDTVLRLGARRETPKGSALFYRDDAADGVWLLEAGTVSILTGTADGAATTRLATFGPGQFVGEMGYIDGKSRSATAKADTTVVALLLDKTAIAELVQHQPAIALKITRNIARELSHRVRSTSAMLTEETAETPSEWSNSYLGGLSRA